MATPCRPLKLFLHFVHFLVATKPLHDIHDSYHITMSTVTDITVAQIISQQIGKRAFFMMGTRQQVGDKDNLLFDICGSKFCKWIRVTLMPSDTYKVTFMRFTRKTLGWTIIDEVEEVYNDQLHALIESKTGLYLSL